MAAILAQEHKFTHAREWICAHMCPDGAIHNNSRSSLLLEGNIPHRQTNKETRAGSSQCRGQMFQQIRLCELILQQTDIWPGLAEQGPACLHMLNIQQGALQVKFNMF